MYWISTGLLTAFMWMSGIMYLLNYEFVSEAYASLGYPSYLIYPVAIAKILAPIAILTRKSAFLKDPGICRPFLSRNPVHFSTPQCGRWWLRPSISLPCLGAKLLHLPEESLS